VDDADYFSSSDYMEYVALGYNFRMSSMTAALGTSQMEMIGDVIAGRRRNARYLGDRLSGTSDVKCPSAPDGYEHVYQLFTIRVEGDGAPRDALQQSLLSKGIMSKVYFHPVHLSQFYRRQFGYHDGHLPVTERVVSQVLSLPMYPTLTDEEMDYIADAVADFFARGEG
jgi:perosamine synthetase